MVGERLMVGRGGKKEILVFKLIILSYFKGRRMDELFTFNSRQLQNITNRAPPLSTSPQYRKRILSNKFSTKLNKLSQIVSEDQGLQSDRLSAKSTTKKVSFKVSSPSVCLRKVSIQHPGMTRQPRSVMIIRKKDKSEEKILEASNSIKTKGESNRIVRKMVARAFSAVERSDRTERTKIEDSIVQPKIQEQIALRRERRINSVKGSPKVLIPVNSKRLPEVFKMKLGEKKNSRFNDLGSKIMSEDVFSLKPKKQWIDLQAPIPLMGLQRWKKMYNLEDKLFEKLHPLKGIRE